MAFPTPTVITSGTAFSGFSGASGLLEALIAAQVATVAPSAATLSETGSGHTLPGATYYVQVTETNGFGETTPTQCGSQAITLGEQLVVTYAGLKTGNFARNVYIGTQSNYSDSKLAASGQTGSTTTFAAPLPTNSYAVAPPTANSTALTYTDALGNTVNKAFVLAQKATKNDLQSAWDYGRQAITNFLQGRPVNFQSEMQKIYHARSVFLLLVQTLTECGTLIDANAGTLHNSSNPIGNATVVRQWP